MKILPYNEHVKKHVKIKYYDESVKNKCIKKSIQTNVKKVKILPDHAFTKCEKMWKYYLLGYLDNYVLVDICVPVNQCSD